MIDRNLEVKENIQLWDRRVLYEVLRDQQTIKPYYEFHRYTDVERYWVAGKYRQVLIAAREVDPSELLEAQEWVNRKLIYTHGYGVCVAPVNEFIENEGNPNFWLKGLNLFLFSLDLKFQSDLDNNNFSTDLRQVFKDNESLLSQNTLVEKRDNKWLITDNSNKRTYNVLKAEGKLKVYPELVVTQPQIYYGELTRDYAIVNTTQKEIDPEGAQYKGEGRDKRDGVRIGGWFRRLCFATRFDFWRMLLSKMPYSMSNRSTSSRKTVIGQNSKSSLSGQVINLRMQKRFIKPYVKFSELASALNRGAIPRTAQSQPSQC